MKIFSNRQEAALSFTHHNTLVSTPWWFYVTYRPFDPPTYWAELYEADSGSDWLHGESIISPIHRFLEVVHPIIPPTTGHRNAK